MSRNSRAPMAPPQDVVMGPPPLPPQAGQSTSNKSRESQDVNEKYSRLKRKYFELEEKYKDAQLQLRSSSERNVKWRAERTQLLDRITELEAGSNVLRISAPIPGPPSNAFPRTLFSHQGQVKFINNLRQAISELEREDPDVDPLILSRHVGPEARKRQEAELRERQEEEAREAKRASRRPRAPAKGKDLGTPLTYAPAPVLASAPPPAPGSDHNPSPPILVSSTGTRLRLKPPAPPASDHGAPTPPGAHGASQHHAIPPFHTRPGSESPISPIHSPQENFPQAITMTAVSPSYHHTPSLPPHAQSQMQMQMVLRASSSKPSEIQRHAKPKRLKAHTVTTKSYSIPTVPRDKKGRPILPLNVGIMTVVRLGEICMREHFHTERYIFPVGYEVTRRYLSTTDPHAEVVYTCTILDGGDGPKFQIVPSDMPDKPVIAGTATGAWSVIVRAANHVRNRQHSNSVSGPDFFGLGQNTIKHLIQELPHANQLKDYVWQHFVEGGLLGGRHAAVTPALPEDNDSGPGYGYSSERGEPEQERPRELQIIQMENDEQGQPRLPAPSTMTPITFHQEYGHPPERQLRERRNSRSSSSNANHDEYRTAPPPPPAATVTGARSGSPTPSYRTTSHSPVLLRDREPYSPKQHHPSSMSGGPSAHTRSHSRSSQDHRSPYQAHAMPSHNGSDQGSISSRTYSAAQTPPPPVPATFASIMNAYPAPPMISSPPSHEQEYPYANGRRNGAPAERFSERADR